MMIARLAIALMMTEAALGQNAKSVCLKDGWYACPEGAICDVPHAGYCKHARSVQNTCYRVMATSSASITGWESLPHCNKPDADYPNMCERGKCPWDSPDNNLPVFGSTPACDPGMGVCPSASPKFEYEDFFMDRPSGDMIEYATTTLGRQVGIYEYQSGHLHGWFLTPSQVKAKKDAEKVGLLDVVKTCISGTNLCCDAHDSSKDTTRCSDAAPVPALAKTGQRAEPLTPAERDHLNGWRNAVNEITATIVEVHAYAVKLALEKQNKESTEKCEAAQKTKPNPWVFCGILVYGSAQWYAPRVVGSWLQNKDGGWEPLTDVEEDAVANARQELVKAERDVAGAHGVEVEACDGHCVPRDRWRIEGDWLLINFPDEVK